METATVLIIFIASLLLGVTGYSMYTAFGPGSKDLRDPFEDHGAIRFLLQLEISSKQNKNNIIFITIA
uniref:photosystem II protein N n=1 Tax=Cryptomonas gyropyrenoidosa TaxID=233257 RepID=UPI0027A03685|nr:photosystem II protein N [Cryptomonas gyropyrenoidosa]WFQ83034.1 photosystem II protein N [Cryptomonas gyropyrenoidosa]